MKVSELNIDRYLDITNQISLDVIIFVVDNKSSNCMISLYWSTFGQLAYAQIEVAIEYESDPET